MPPVLVGIGEVLWDVFPDQRRLGGAPFNVVYHAHALGAGAVVVSRIGADELGREILSRMHGLKLDTRCLQLDRRHPTSRVLVKLKRSGVPDFEILPDVAWDYLRATSVAHQTVSRADAVVFGTLAQRSEISRGAIRRLLSAAKSLVVYDVNLRQEYYTRELIETSLSMAQMLKCNQEEFDVLQRLLRVPGRSGGPRVHPLAQRYGLKLICVTRGARGCVLYGRRTVTRHPGFGVKVADTVGSGDAFTAALTLSYLAGRPLARVARDANLAGAYVASQPGATPEMSPAILRRFAAQVSENPAGRAE